MELTFDFASDRTAPAQARAALSSIEDLVAPALVQDLRYVITELVSNAVVHGPGQGVRVKLRVSSPHKVVGEVVDEGEGLVAIRHAGRDAPDGRGLQIVDSVASRWGVYEGSTHVWFELHAPAEH